MKIRRRQLMTGKGTNRLGQWGLLSAVSLIWLLLAGLIGFVDPQVVKDLGMTDSFLPLPLLLMLAVTGTLGLIRHSWFKGLSWGLGLGFYIALRIAGLGEWMNAVLILVFLLLVEWYWHEARDKISLNE